MNYQSIKSQFDQFLKHQSDLYIPAINILNSAMNYSLLADGKRIRPLLVHSFGQIFNGDTLHANICGMAVEMIHTYSLIHDDLPSMDNDDFRRGRPTNHKVFGEATAILAGDALLNFGPEYLVLELKNNNFPEDKVLLLAQTLLKASGHNGMVKGQILDLEFEKKDHSIIPDEELLSQLEQIHQLKTASLIKWSCVAGLMTSPDETSIKNHINNVNLFGEKLGLLFQIVDDYLDSTASFKEIGKTPGKDHKNGKLTYTTLLGIDKTKEKAQHLIDELRNQFIDFKSNVILDEIISGLERKLT